MCRLLEKKHADLDWSDSQDSIDIKEVYILAKLEVAQIYLIF